MPPKTHGNEHEYVKYLTAEEQAEAEELTRTLLKHEQEKADYDDALKLKKKGLKDYGEAISHSESYLERLRLQLDRAKLLVGPPFREPARLIYDEARLDYFAGMIQQRKEQEQWKKAQEKSQQDALNAIESERRRRQQIQLNCELEAAARAHEYSLRLNTKLKKFKHPLQKKSKDAEVVFQKLVKDHRYLGYSFESCLPTDERGECEAVIEQRVRKIIPARLAKFITCECEISYFLLPKAEYSLEELPCLDFNFDIFAIAEVRFWMKPNTVEINGCFFPMPRIIHEGYAVELKEPQSLGYAYRLLTPGDFSPSSFYWQSIPVILMAGLMNGVLEPEGTKVIEATEVAITYKIEGLDDEIYIPNNFADYLVKVKKNGDLASLGIICEKVAATIEHLGQTSAVPAKADVSDNSDVVDALVALGSKAVEAKKKVQAINFPAGATSEEKVKFALKTPELDKDKNYSEKFMGT